MIQLDLSADTLSKALGPPTDGCWDVALDAGWGLRLTSADDGIALEVDAAHTDAALDWLRARIASLIARFVARGRAHLAEGRTRHAATASMLAWDLVPDDSRLQDDAGMVDVLVLASEATLAESNPSAAVSYLQAARPLADPTAQLRIDQLLEQARQLGA